MSEALFEGIRIQDASTVGSLSMLDRLALALNAEGGGVDHLRERLGLSPQELRQLYYDPRYTLRPVQQAPEDYRTFFFLGGRGSGKTHAGSVAVIREAMADPDGAIVIVGPTYSDIEENQVLGSSGILTLCPPWFTPRFLKAKHKLIFPNGVEAKFVPACDPDKFRGKACSFLWADEIVAWKKDEVAVFNECRTVSRLYTPRMWEAKREPRMFITTTPAPTPLFREVLKHKDGMVLAKSTTFDNEAHLPPDYIRQKRAIAHTTEGRKEFMGELFFTTDANLFSKVDWDKSRVPFDAAPDEFDIIVVSVDPATGEKKGADYHGIVVVGLREEKDGLLHSYVLRDHSMRSPNASEWAKVAVREHRYWSARARRDCFIHAETNTGGSMVTQVIRQVDTRVPVKTMRALNSKAERAAPVSALAEAGLVHLVGNKMQGLEKQLADFTGEHGRRDDRVDAMVWPIYRWAVRDRRNTNLASPGEEAPADAA